MRIILKPIAFILVTCAILGAAAVGVAIPLGLIL